MNRNGRITTDVDRAAEVLRAGGLVAMPTETVYGLAAPVSRIDSIRRVYDVKGRPADHPLIVHVASADAASGVAVLNDVARRLAERFWPGPLTMLLLRTAAVPDEVTGGRDTVAVRVPNHPLALALLAHFPEGLVAPSANRFGRVSPTCAAHVLDDLDDDVDLVLDGGTCAIGVESSIVDCTTQPVSLLRPGGVTIEALRDAVPDISTTASGPSRASGMLPSHYAPRCRVELCDTAADAANLAALRRSEGRHAIVLDLADDPPRYAQRLYEELRRADAESADVLIAVLPSSGGLGDAVRDRLTKASHRTE